MNLSLLDRSDKLAKRIGSVFSVTCLVRPQDHRLLTGGIGARIIKAVIIACAKLCKGQQVRKVGIGVNVAPLLPTLTKLMPFGLKIRNQTLRLLALSVAIEERLPNPCSPSTPFLSQLRQRV